MTSKVCTEGEGKQDAIVLSDDSDRSAPKTPEVRVHTQCYTTLLTLSINLQRGTPSKKSKRLTKPCTPHKVRDHIYP